ncbi:hypothetical protein CH278_02095 [Rhodococcus sp. 05-2254-5]|jgi:hypothetical protein|uniref:hypothetical protein n=1 Tax=unclassified Rhodococcus (in: high G+C Gram-positive bacteria) TaxID=192944 RepID=UPI000B9C3AED|nr:MULTISPECIES: hypothetical protein [unclassified Rhodococcus (in: high G+C Gram-positive bacteria)]OZE39096.1 hypothetical protein CH278_02095 [Rhodococcus sp. 05-2254-5]OZE59037.1 hypothetical protein CH269_08590 [Rhodococcus sp. 05-2254-1]
MAKQYIGVAALTIVKLKSTGSRAYVYKGQPVGSDVSREEIKRLEDEGFIAEVVVIEDPVDLLIPDGEPPSDQPPASTGNPDRPEPTATKAEWVAYAVKVHEATDGAAGFAEDAAEDLTRAKLIELLP